MVERPVAFECLAEKETVMTLWCRPERERRVAGLAVQTRGLVCLIESGESIGWSGATGTERNALSGASGRYPFQFVVNEIAARTFKTPVGRRTLAAHGGGVIRRC